ncbi:MAG: M15 family metallopeptidase, partial [Clostridia bacterium]|nr:M15 family metallopeptidase [Clostridia bacterium]
ALCVVLSFASCAKGGSNQNETSNQSGNTEISETAKKSRKDKEDETTQEPTTKNQPLAANWDYAYALETPRVADTDDEWNLILVNRDYVLPENYIDSVELVNVCSTDERLDKRVAEHYEEMFNAAAADGLYLTPCSGYRSYELQKRNFQNRIDMCMGQGMTMAEATVEASKVILPPGTSEHNAGIAMDIICVLDSFEDTAHYAWLCENAQDYGFILRYPKDKQDITKIVFEPWHWRYVGVEAAREMKKSGECLEEYILNH